MPGQRNAGTAGSHPTLGTTLSSNSHAVTQLHSQAHADLLDERMQGGGGVGGGVNGQKLVLQQLRAGGSRL
eukprot:5431582-Pyramimonas_sp.AAC.1